MALSRRQIREHIFRLIFDYEFCPACERDEQTELYFEQVPDEEIPNPPLFAAGEDRQHITEKAQEGAQHLVESDTALNEAAKGWTTGRMAKADLAVLRLAVYELFFDDLIPTGVAINEAVELAKQYGGDESPAFINGILAKLAQSPQAKESENRGRALRAEMADRERADAKEAELRQDEPAPGALDGAEA